ncbi:MAG: glycosyltransferase family 2 protein [Chloroflexi bacterium]|nr:glycosyltransferase family 2 protein [Chloroflexota bacterium]
MAAGLRDLGLLSRRALEFTTGAVTWTLITLPIWGALLFPDTLVFLLLAFNGYWFYKSSTMAICAVAGYRRLQRDQRRDWLADCRRLSRWDQLQHLVMIPTAGEAPAILRKTLEELSHQDFPRRNISVLLAFEERDPNARIWAQELLAEFKDAFANVWATFHPDLPGEVRGKSSNLAYAGRRARALMADGLGIDMRKVLVTVCDADSRLHPKYLSALTHSFLSDPNGAFRLYQPALLFYSNIWRVPASLRPLDGLYSVWQIARMVARHRLINQSTYSLTLAACDRVGYWDPDVIPEDSRMFFKVFFAYGQKTRVQPIFLPVHADAAEGIGFWSTIVSHYRQTRRWAWGASDLAYVVQQVFARTEIPIWTRISRAASYAEDHIAWPVHWFLITLGAHALDVLAPGFSVTVVAQTVSTLSSNVLTACIPCLLTAAWIDLRMRPVREVQAPWWDNVVAAGAWLALPVLGLIGSALPALDAHTRLLLGRPLNYQVTVKFAASSAHPARGWARDAATTEAA